MQCKAAPNVQHDRRCNIAPFIDPGGELHVTRVTVNVLAYTTLCPRSCGGLWERKSGWARKRYSTKSATEYIIDDI